MLVGKEMVRVLQTVLQAALKYITQKTETLSTMPYKQGTFQFKNPAPTVP